MKKILFLYFLLTAQLMVLYAQEGETAAETTATDSGAETDVETDAGDAVEGGEGGDFKFNQEDYQNQLLEQQRNNLLACFVLTKNLLHKETNNILEVIKGRDQQKFYKKIVAENMKSCFYALPFEESAKLLAELNNSERDKVDLEPLFQYLSFNVEKYKDANYPTKLEGEEEHLYKYAEDLEESIRKRYGGQEGGESGFDEGTGFDDYDYEPSIAGLSLKETRGSFAFMYMLGIFGFIGLLIFIGYRQLFGQKASLVDKKREEAKRKREARKKN